MNSEYDLEHRLDAIGKALRERLRLSDRVMDQVRALPDGSMQQNECLLNDASGGNPSANALPISKDGTAPKRHRSRRNLFLRWCGAATLCACGLALLIVFFPARSVGWEDVAKAVQKHEWMRRRSFANGGEGVTWFSAAHRIWAYRITTRHNLTMIIFADGREGAKYEYNSRRGEIVKLPLNDDDKHRAMPDGDLAQKNDSLSPWLFTTETVIQQKEKRRIVEENGRRWVEFDVVYTRTGESGTVRVDPTTLLPVSEFSKSPNGEKTNVFEFDFPADGPRDIFELGAPRTAKVEDRIPSEECQKALAGMAASRALIGDFRLLVAAPSNLVAATPNELPADFDLAVSGDLYQVWRKGSRWRVDRCWRDPNDPQPLKFKGESWKEYFEETLSNSPLIPKYVCDGQTVFENNSRFWLRDAADSTDPTEMEPATKITPLALLNCGRSRILSFGISFVERLYPDLSPTNGWGFEFDPAPKDFPEGVLVKFAFNLNNGTVAHEWYYLDRSKGYILSRVVHFGLPPEEHPSVDAANSWGTTTMKGFQKSPQGWWYATEIEETHFVSDEGEEKESPRRTTTDTTRYIFDFGKEIKDELFTVEKVVE